MALAGGEFHDGLLLINSERVQYVDRSGKVMIDNGLAIGWDFSEGLAAAKKPGNDLWGFIDRSGEFVVAQRLYQYPAHFSDGLAKLTVGDKVGYIGKDGQFAIPPKFWGGSDFKEGLARVLVAGQCVMLSDGVCGEPKVVGRSSSDVLPHCHFEYIDKSGKIVTKGQFEGGRDFSEGLAPVRVGQLWGFIDRSGAMVIAPRFEDAWPFSDGLARVREGRLQGYIDKSGKLVIQMQFQHAQDFREGFAVVRDGSGRFRYIDQSGKHVLGGGYEAASHFFKGLAHVRQGKRFSYIDTTGKVVFQY